MAVGSYWIDVYSNDGTTRLQNCYVGYDTATTDKGYVEVTETGYFNAFGSYTYNGKLKFAGFAKTPNATVPDFAVGDTFTIPDDVTMTTNYTNLYIVESLEGITVTVPSGWSANFGFGQFRIRGILNDYGTLNTYDVFNIGYSLDEGNLTARQEAVTFRLNLGGEYYFQGFSQHSGFIITVEGGNDVTNPSLIQWLYKYGELITEEPEQPEEPTTPTKKFTRLFLGAIAHTSNGKRFRKLQDTEYVEPNEEYLTFSSPSTFTLGVVDNTKYWDGTLEYSTDAKTWNTWSGTSAINSSDSGNLYLRGTGNTYITGSGVGYSQARWVLTGSDISCNGNVETLLDYATVVNGEHPTMASFCYNQMFYGCTNLITAPELPATTLARYCYYQMFNGCTSLATAPELPATTLAVKCYDYMFFSCTSLVTAPELPATTLADSCYYYMFAKCTSLITAPELPATTLADSCYYGMFLGCTSLITAPELPATTLAYSCYRSMFAECINITTVPELPATTLANYCYYSMFNGCRSIKLSETYSDRYPIPCRIPSDIDGTVGSQSLVDMFANTNGSFTGTPSINTTYYSYDASITTESPFPYLTIHDVYDDCYVYLYDETTQTVLINNQQLDRVVDFQLDYGHSYMISVWDNNSSRPGYYYGFAVYTSDKYDDIVNKKDLSEIQSSPTILSPMSTDGMIYLNASYGFEDGWDKLPHYFKVVKV